MRSITLMLLSLILSGCQINPYTFQPGWTSPDWFTAGKEDAMNGVPVKDNRGLWPIVLMTLRLIEGNIFVATLTDRKNMRRGLYSRLGD